MMIGLIDKLLILFIYINILFPLYSVGPVPVGKFTAGLLILGYCIYANEIKSKIPVRIINYILLSFIFISILALVSLILGNQFDIIFSFCTEIFILCLIPPLLLLITYYSVDRYLRHMLIAITILSLYIITLYIQYKYLGMRTAVERLNAEGMISASSLGGDPKITITTGGFFPCGLVIAYYSLVKRKNLWSGLCLISIVYALYISRTIGLWVASGGALGFFALFDDYSEARRVTQQHGLAVNASSVTRKISFNFRRWCVCVVLFCAGIFLYNHMNFPFLRVKRASIGQKEMQTMDAFKMFSEKPIWGYGLGYLYHRAEFPSLSKPEQAIFESSYAMIFSSTGLVGALFYMFIYLYYPFLYAMRTGVTSAMRLFFSAHLAVMIAGGGNPYIWSGGLGLFFMCFLAAMLERQQVQDLSIFSTLSSSFRNKL